MTKPSTGLILKTAVVEGLKEMLRLPLWWYTSGLVQTYKRLFASVKGSVRFFGVDVWAKNLFIPMYGDTSVAGRSISFLVRITVLFVRSLGVVAWVFVAAILAMAYVFILPVAVIGFFSHLVGVFI